MCLSGCSHSYSFIYNGLIIYITERTHLHLVNLEIISRYQKTFFHKYARVVHTTCSLSLFNFLQETSDILDVAFERLFIAVQQQCRRIGATGSNAMDDPVSAQIKKMPSSEL